MHRFLLMLVAVIALASHAFTQETPLKRLGYWGISLRAPRPPQPGAEVTEVRSGSPADRLHLHKGDRFLRANGRPIMTGRDIDEYLLRFREGDTVSIDLEHDAIASSERVTLPPYPAERFEHATVIHDMAISLAGDRVRLIVTRPSDATGPTPAVFFVGWLSCDSVEYPFGETDGFGAIIRRIADQSHYVTVRVDKPGVGDSEGPACSQLDFVRELAAYRAAFASISRYAFIDPSRVFVLGLSNGGGFAPLVADGAPVRGYIAAGSWGRSWYEHMIEHERRRLMRSGTPLGQVDDSMRTFLEFYRLFLVQKGTPGAILADHPGWRPLWYDADEGMYGRPAAFYQQLQDLNVAAAWSRTNVAALVLRGSADMVMSRADSEALAEIVNKANAGTATYREIDGADHLFTRGADFASDTVTVMLEWMRSQL